MPTVNHQYMTSPMQMSTNHTGIAIYHSNVPVGDQNKSVKRLILGLFLGLFKCPCRRRIYLGVLNATSGAGAGI